MPRVQGGGPRGGQRQRTADVRTQEGVTFADMMLEKRVLSGASSPPRASPMSFAHRPPVDRHGGLAGAAHGA